MFSLHFTPSPLPPLASHLTLLTHSFCIIYLYFLSPIFHVSHFDFLPLNLITWDPTCVITTYFLAESSRHLLFSSPPFFKLFLQPLFWFCCILPCEFHFHVAISRHLTVKSFCLPAASPHSQRHLHFISSHSVIPH